MGESAVIHRSTTKTMIPNGYAILYGRDGIVYPRKVRETLYQCLVKAVEALKLKSMSVIINYVLLPFWVESFYFSFSVFNVTSCLIFYISTYSITRNREKLKRAQLYRLLCCLLDNSNDTDSMFYFSNLLIVDVSIDENVRGPAVGIIINTKKGDIDIDLSPSVEVNDIKLKGWPNGGSKVFDSTKGKQIKKEVENAKIHLVPKKDLFWRISYSNKIKELINSMDRTGECRKRTHKILKYDFQMWKIEERCRFEGISTYIFSVSVF